MVNQPSSSLCPFWLSHFKKDVSKLDSLEKSDRIMKGLKNTTYQKKTNVGHDSMFDT